MTVVTAIAPPGNMVVTNTEALDNFYDTYKSLGGSNTLSWPFPGYPAFPPTSAQLLTNGTFEIPDAFPGAISGAPGWTTFESVFTKATVDQFNNFGPVSHDAGGTQFLTMFGPFSNQAGANASGAFQSVDAVPGADYVASVWVMNWQPDALMNLGIVELTFWDGPNGTGTQLASPPQVLVDADPATGNLTLAPQDGADVSDWTQISISATAPPGTVSAKVFLLHIQIGGPNCPRVGLIDDCLPGSIFWDDASLIGPPTGSSTGFNTLVFSDEFDPNTQIDLNKWTLETGTGSNGWGNNEWQVYTADPNNISIITDPNDVNDGVLQISALLDTAQCPAPAVGVCGFQDGTITSARINTLPIPFGSMMSGYAFRYGRIEASIKLPIDGYGTWPAFWMLGDRINATPPVIWPEIGEIDVVEMFGKLGTTNQEAHFTLHWCDENFKPAGAPVCFPGFMPDNGYRSATSISGLGAPLGNAFRTYSAEWDATGITWKVDGITYNFTAIQPATMEEFLEKFFIILNVAIGGNPFGGFGTPESAPDATGWPREMLVDWVRVYQ
jgi:beta-glucanase (GH16 family)